MKRLLWVGKAPSDGAAGDEVYDRKMIAALGQLGVEVEVVHPRRVGRVAELANLARGIPHYRAQYASAENAGRLAAAAKGQDVAIVSWEPFDMLAWSLPIPAIPILHNVTSLSLPSMFPSSPAAHALAAVAGHWQRRAYGSSRFPAIAVLSRADEAYIRSIAPKTPVIYAPPGLPPLTPLRPDARFLPELVLSGTYDWKPKRRDLMRFAQSYAALGAPWPVYADNLPAEAAALVRPQPTASLDPGAALRIGIVPDTFVAGHKLKVGSYIASNAVPVALGDLESEFVGTTRGYLFDKVAVKDLPHIMARLQSTWTVDTWSTFQTQSAAALDWTLSAARLLESVG